jgi:hypothetical protein
MPYLTLEHAAYRFGVKANAEETFTYRGDSIYYIPGTPYYQQYALGSGTYTFAHTAHRVPRVGRAPSTRSSVCWHDAASGTYGRLFHTKDYTDSSGGFTILPGTLADDPLGSVIKVVYGSATAATYNAVGPPGRVGQARRHPRQGHRHLSMPGRGQRRLTRWTGVQSFEATRRVTLDNDEEFGNYHYVSQDYDVADVTGTIGVRARDVTDLFTKIAEVTDVPTNEIAGALSSQPLQVEARIYDPNSATPSTLKTIYIEDARFTPPATQGRVQQKLESPFPFTSDSGSIKVYKGNRP